MTSPDRRHRGAHLGTLLGVFAALVAAGTAACSDTTGPGVRHELATSRWDEAGLEDYSFVYEQLCFCPFTGPHRVTVEGGAVVDVTPLPGSNSVGELDPEYFPTIDDLLERLRDAAERNPVQFDVTYDDELGYPNRADVDISEQIVDEEYSFEVSELAAT
ncbi:MAG: DUF6174 domain-containing protein [Gemmatimonadota bacterium]